MSGIDWTIVAFYFAGMVGLSVWLGLRQRSGEDYFLGGRQLKGGLIALSLAANQVSAISLIGAPAFVALEEGGGLRWLQYEFAVPLAMIVIIFLVVPLYRRLSGATIYEYTERRFGLPVRLIMSALFMISRGLAAGVMLYTSAIVLSVTLQVHIVWTIGGMGVIAILYTTIGGITADVFSDAFQLVILVLGTIVAVMVALPLVGGFEGAVATLQDEPTRLRTIDFVHHGLGDGHSYSLWPMLIGGLFLYLSYYGCDQSQAQRLMSTPSEKSANNGLMLNGLIRFPIVLSYCLLGLLLAAFLVQNQTWASRFQDSDPNYLVPVFIIDYLPVGVVGLFMAGIFAATMSSIDSALNSLSAVTMTDFVGRFRPAVLDNQKRFLFWSRITTLFWGLFCMASGYFITRAQETVIVIVNSIGSLFYGPILAVFVAGALSRRANGQGAVVGLAAGFAVNLSLWVFVPGVSWLWWNPIGFFSSLVTIWAVSFVYPAPGSSRLIWTLHGLTDGGIQIREWLNKVSVWILVVAFIAIVVITFVFGLLAK